MSEIQNASRLLNPLAFNLQKLGLELKCPVCLNLLNKPVLLPCNHVFCDFCVPKMHKVRVECPACQQGFTDQETRPASHLDNIVIIYKSLNATFNSTVFPLLSAVADKDGTPNLTSVAKLRKKPISASSKEDNKHDDDDSLAIKPSEGAFKLTQCPSSDELDVHHSTEMSPGSSPSSGVAKDVKCHIGDPSSRNESTESHGIKRSAAGSSLITAECQMESKRQKRLSYGSSEPVLRSHTETCCRKIVCHSEQAEVSSVANNDASEGLNQTVCAFCHCSKTTEVTGTLLHYADGKEVSKGEVAFSKSIPVHTKCIEWAPQVYFDGDTIKNLEPELGRASKLKCSSCGLKGAALGCFANSCRKTYHVPCALEIPGCRWDCDNFIMLCPTHKSTKFPSEKSSSRKHHTIEKSSLLIQTTPEQLNFWSTSSLNGPREWAFCGSALSSEEKSLLVKFGAICGATVFKSWNPKVTHIIASTDANGACSRTYKVLMAILNGKWVLTIDWVKACVEANRPVEEEPYEVDRDNHGCNDGPKAGRLRASYNGPKIFNGLSFYIHGDFVPKYKNDLIDLVRVGGGTIIESFERKENCPVYVVYNRDLGQDFSLSDASSSIVLNHRAMEAEKVARDIIDAQVVPHTWILDSIAACRVLTAN